MRHYLALAAGAVLSLPAAAAQAADPPPLSAFSQPPALDELALSPDGKHLAYVSRDPYAIVILNQVGAIEAALAVSKTRISDLQWIDDTHLMSVRTGFQALGSLAGPQLLRQAVVFDLVEKKLRVPLARSTTTAAVLIGAAIVPGSFEGRPAYYTAAWGQAGELPDKSLFRNDLSNGQSVVVDRGSFDSAEWVVTPTGQLLARTTYDPSSDRWSLDARIGKAWKTVRTEKTSWPATLVGQGRTDGTIALVTRDGEIVEQDATSPGPGVSVAPDGSVVLDQYFDRITGRLVAVKTAGEPPAYTFFDPVLKTSWAKILKAFKGKRVNLLNFSADMKSLAVEVNEDGGPPTAYLVEVSEGRASLLGPSRPDLKPEQVGKVQRVEYTARDGLPLTGYLTLPPGRAPTKLPLVVLLADYPQSAAGLGFDRDAQVLASRGYAVFQPNVRGSQASDRRLADAGLGQLGKGMETDILDGVAHLASTGVVDAGRVCLMGEGYGGYAAAAAVTLHKASVRCAIAVRGDFDLQHFKGEDDKMTRGAWRLRSTWRRYIAGDQSPTDAQIDAVAPIKHARDASAPILMIVRAEDEGSRERASAFHAVLNSAGKPNSVTVLKAETTNLEPSSAEKTWTAELDLLAKYNPAG